MSQYVNCQNCINEGCERYGGAYGYTFCDKYVPNIAKPETIALSTIQAENEKLRAELEYEKEYENAYYEECGQWEAENAQLRAELEQVTAERDAAVRQVALISQPNEPLTLEQLREMDGEPVWIANPDALGYGRWGIVDGVYQAEDDQVLMLRGDYSCHYYGKTWLAYRRPPKGENHHG